MKDLKANLTIWETKMPQISTKLAHGKLKAKEKNRRKFLKQANAMHLEEYKGKWKMCWD